MIVLFLHEQSANDAADVEIPGRANIDHLLHQAAFLLLHEEVEHTVHKTGGDDDFGENIVDGFGRSHIERSIHCHNPAESRFWISG